jgi:hypothetical protein
MGNTIYEDYTKVSDRYYLSQSGKYFWQPMVKGIKIAGFTEFDLFILKSNEGYLLCEALTGTMILKQKELNSRILRRMCLRLFIKSLPDLLTERGGVGNINQAIINFIFDNEQRISPRYKSKENVKDQLQNLQMVI